MHDNSLSAWIQNQKTFSAREKLILEKVVTRPQGMTDREIKDSLGFGDMNCVRPRITELIKEGWMEECGTSYYPVLKTTVRIVRATGKLTQHGVEQQSELFK
jgi:predicted transcriptional regulator